MVRHTPEDTKHRDLVRSPGVVGTGDRRVVGADRAAAELQVGPSKTDAERLLLVSPELAEVLTAIIFRVRAGNAALPLVSAYDVFEQTWSPPMPFLFQRRFCSGGPTTFGGSLSPTPSAPGFPRTSRPRSADAPQ